MKRRLRIGETDEQYDARKCYEAAQREWEQRLDDLWEADPKGRELRAALDAASKHVEELGDAIFDRKTELETTDAEAIRLDEVRRAAQDDYFEKQWHRRRDEEPAESDSEIAQ